MREIKFKIWTGEAMLSSDDYSVLPFHISIFDSRIRMYTEHMGEYYLSECGENVKALQFTGLKDKNGKDIYEGDIVEYTIDDEDIIGDVFFCSGDFAVLDDEFNWTSLSNFLIGYGLDVDMAVIGNIYENPELLERNK